MYSTGGGWVYISVSYTTFPLDEFLLLLKNDFGVKYFLLLLNSPLGDARIQLLYGIEDAQIHQATSDCGSIHPFQI